MLFTRATRHIIILDAIINIVVEYSTFSYLHAAKLSIVIPLISVYYIYIYTHKHIYTYEEYPRCNIYI